MPLNQATIQQLLGQVGITINGRRPWDIQVHDQRLYQRVITHGSLGLGESYLDGWWDCEQLDEFFYRILRSGVASGVGLTFAHLRLLLIANIVNLQKKSRAFQIGTRHYDLGNDLYAAMLDTRMTYSCGYWHNAENLDQAQERKLDLICRKLGLKRGQKILDIGCGWGSLVRYAAERYGVSAVGITVSKNQAELARQRCRGLPVEIRLQDYRDLPATPTAQARYDHIVSVGMFEHVGVKNYPTFFDVIRRNLKDTGLFLLHTIASNISKDGTDPWISRYIFPNSMLPSAKKLTAAIEGRFSIEDWHSFGADYDLTLMSWYQNFAAAWPKLKARYDERFYRMWRYYLLSCAGLFRARHAQLWQIVLSKDGVLGGYRSVR